MNLRHLLAVPLVFAISSAQPRARAQDTPDKPQDQLHVMSRQELDVVKVRLAQEKAWNTGNLEEYARAYKDSADTLFVGPKMGRGISGMLADYRHNYPTRESMGTLSYSDLEPHTLDENFSVVTGRYHLERGKKAGGNADGVFSLILEKTALGWKIIVDHTT